MRTCLSITTRILFPLTTYYVLLTALLFFLPTPAYARARCDTLAPKSGLFHRLFDTPENDCSAYPIDGGEVYTKSIESGDPTCADPGDLEAHLTGNLQRFFDFGGTVNNLAVEAEIKRVLGHLSSFSAGDDQYQRLIDSNQPALFAAGNLTDSYAPGRIEAIEAETNLRFGTTPSERHIYRNAWESLTGLPTQLNRVCDMADLIVKCNADPNYNAHCFNDYEIGTTTAVALAKKLTTTVCVDSTMNEKVKTFLALPEETKKLSLAITASKAQEYVYIVAARSRKADTFLARVANIIDPPDVRVAIVHDLTSRAVLEGVEETFKIISNKKVNDERFSYVHAPKYPNLTKEIEATPDSPITPQQYQNLKIDDEFGLVQNPTDLYPILNAINRSGLKCDETGSQVLHEFMGGYVELENPATLTDTDVNFTLKDKNSLDQLLAEITPTTSVWLFTANGETRKINDLVWNYGDDQALGKGLHPSLNPLKLGNQLTFPGEALGTRHVCANEPQTTVSGGASRTAPNPEIIPPTEPGGTPEEIYYKINVNFTPAANTPRAPLQGCNATYMAQVFTHQKLVSLNLANQRLSCQQDYYADLCAKIPNAATIYGVSCPTQSPCKPATSSTGSSGQCSSLTYEIPYHDTTIPVRPVSDLKAIYDPRFPGNQLEAFYDIIINRAQAAGYNPAFVLAVWLEETGASDYQSFGTSIYDFGCGGAEKGNVLSGLQCFLSLYTDWSAGGKYDSLMSSCREGGANPSFEDFMLFFAEGICTTVQSQNRQFCRYNHSLFPGKIRQFYNSVVAPGYQIP